MQGDKGFKIRISADQKSGIRLPIRGGGVLDANQTFDLTAEEFFHTSVQLAIQKNLVIVEKRMTEEEAKGKLYRSVRIQSMNVPQLGGIIHHNQKFFVPNDKLNENAVAMIVREKWIVPAEESLPEEVVHTAPSAVLVKEETGTVQKRTARNSKKSQTKKEEKETVKAIRGVENIPANMHVHVPNAVMDDVSIRKVPKANDMILNVTAESESEEISFVDEEQMNAKLKENNMENNEEVQ